MKNIIYRRADNTFALGMPSPKHIAAAMGSGGLLPSGVAFEREIAKSFVTVDNQAEFDAGWEAFLAARKDSARGVALRRLYTYFRDGGATEAEAYEALGDVNKPADCVDHRAVENSDLPPDKDFMDAWEWSD
jgi:hypothetical protein